MQQSLQPKVQSWNCPSPVVPELAFRKTNGYEALTVPSGCANWSDRRLTTNLSALRPKLNDVFVFFVPDSPLCPMLFSVPQKLNISDWPIISNKIVNTVLVGQSFHNVPSHSITFPSAQTDSSWTVQREINDKHVFVTTVG